MPTHKDPPPKNPANIITSQADPAPDSDESASEAATQNPRGQRPREEIESPEAEVSDEEGGRGASSTNAMIQKMVRLALSSEYSRLPIRRADITAKVLGAQGSRQFKVVFESAQRELRKKFGMEMTELPAREKVTVTQRRGEFSFTRFCSSYCGLSKGQVKI